MSKTHHIGYEVDSKQIRAYEINDCDSVYRALAVNTQEYLVHEGLEEDSPVKLGNVLLQAAAISVGLYIFVAKVSLRTSPFLTAASFSLYGLLIGGMIVSAYLRQNGCAIFQGTGNVKQGVEVKSLFQSFRGRRLRVLLEMEDFSPEVRFIAEFVTPSHLFSRPKVLYTASRKTQFGKYFGSTGFFYPPALIKDINALLEQLVVESKQRGRKK